MQNVDTPVVSTFCFVDEMPSPGRQRRWLGAAGLTVIDSRRAPVSRL
jgi:hypothetical protein